MKRSAALGAAAGAAALAGGALRRRSRTAAVRASPGRDVDAGDAVVNVLEAGRGDPVVLVHGFAASIFSFREAMPLLAANHRVLALDLPGFGSSGRDPSIDFGQDAQARRVASVMESLETGPAVIVGHSMGGAIAERLAIAHPDLVRALVLVAAVDASVRPEWRGQRLAGSRPQELGMRAFGAMPPLVRAMAKSSLRRIVYDRSHVTDAVVRGYTEPLLRPGTAACLAKMARDARATPLAEIGRISAPTLVSSGADDTVVPPATGEGIAAKIPGARHLVIERSGHLVPEERPDEFVAAVLAFERESAGA